jgi:hypothetical protein
LIRVEEPLRLLNLPVAEGAVEGLDQQLTVLTVTRSLPCAMHWPKPTAA